MSGTKEIKNRIKNILDTRKITNAMYLIASTKMRKAKNKLDETRPYFDSLKAEIKRIFRTVKDLDNKYFFPVNSTEAKDGTYGIVVITADKGLAGAYNINVIKETLRLLKDHEDSKLFIIGEYGRQYFKRQGITIQEDFEFTGQEPTLEEARLITTYLLDKYNSKEIDKIFVVYTDIGKRLDLEVISTRLLPFHREIVFNSKEEKVVENAFEFMPSIEAVLDHVIESYISGFVFGALVDSFCSEQSARIDATRSANSNSDELLQDLYVEYNRVRQTAITQEITEISAGAKSQKLKKKEAKKYVWYRWNNSD